MIKLISLIFLSNINSGFFIKSIQLYYAYCYQSIFTVYYWNNQKNALTDIKALHGKIVSKLCSSFSVPQKENLLRRFVKPESGLRIIVNSISTKSFFLFAGSYQFLAYRNIFRTKPVDCFHLYRSILLSADRLKTDR